LLFASRIAVGTARVDIHGRSNIGMSQKFLMYFEIDSQRMKQRDWLCLNVCQPIRCLGNKLCWKIAKIDAASLIPIRRPWNSFH
jgi:hypothetical protein